MEQDNLLKYSSIITAKIVDEENGAQVIKNISGIRIKSKGYRILILADYTPLLGQVEGDVTFLTDKQEYVFDNIFGYYKHQKNEFTLIIKKDFDGWYKKV